MTAERNNESVELAAWRAYSIKYVESINVANLSNSYDWSHSYPTTWHGVALNLSSVIFFQFRAVPGHGIIKNQEVDPNLQQVVFNPAVTHTALVSESGLLMCHFLGVLTHRIKIFLEMCMRWQCCLLSSDSLFDVSNRISSAFMFVRKLFRG